MIHYIYSYLAMIYLLEVNIRETLGKGVKFVQS